MNLIDLFKSKTRQKILQFFFSNKEKKYYLRELERILSLPVGNVRRELISLEKLGLFKKEKMGNLVYYALNKDSPFFEVLENLISKSITIKKAKKRLKKDENQNLVILKKTDLNLLTFKMNELNSLFATFLRKNSECEDFINLGVVVNNKGKVLIMRRLGHEKGKNESVLTWAFPDGNQRTNETRSQCVARGILEKTGYEAESIKEISSRFHPQFPVFIVYHLCRLVSIKPIPRPKKGYEIIETRWVKPEEIPKLFTTNFDPRVKRELGLQ